MVTLYIFKKINGEFLYQDMGNPENILKDLGDDKDFTLTPPPDDTKVWHWIDSRWQ